MFGYFFDITASDIATTTDYVGKLVSDLSPFILLIIGLFIAFYIIREILHLL